MYLLFIVMRLTVLMVFTQAFVVGNLLAQGCNFAGVETMSASGSAKKCGYTGCTSTCPPTYYLIITQTENDNYQYANSSESESGMLQTTMIDTMDATNCTQTRVYSGKASYSISPDPNNISSKGSIIDSSTGEWDAGGGEAEANNGDLGNYLWYDCVLAYDVPVNEKSLCTNDVSSYSGKVSATLGDSFFSSDSSSKTLYSKEFNDVMLRNLLIGSLSAYPGWAHKNGGFAQYKIECDHASCTGAKMQYRFWVDGQYTSVKGAMLRLDWYEVQAFDAFNCGCYTNIPQPAQKRTPKTWTVRANGDPAGMYVYPPNNEVPVPADSSTISETSAIITPVSGGPGGDGGHKGF